MIPDRELRKRMARITNEEIMQELVAIRTTMEFVAKQAEKTNGRVNTIEQWMNGIQAIDNYKKEQQPVINADKVFVNKWKTSDKLIAAVTALIVAVTLGVQVLVTKIGQ